MPLGFEDDSVWAAAGRTAAEDKTINTLPMMTGNDRIESKNSFPFLCCRAATPVKILENNVKEGLRNKNTIAEV